ncbi:MAG: helix-turn-helix transcriptional regulator [Alphaproteobacteria bacterium]|nr:helix-turn-helix transcriptional regulator [Alphaproteobacteria bacterium]
MLTHQGIWAAIDALAARYGYSASGLAKRGGLDPTTFNRSKRLSREGKPRWPSTESIAKVLEATGCPLADFVALIGEAGGESSAYHLPVIRLSDAAVAGRFTPAGRASGEGWDEIAFPDLRDPEAFAIEIVGGDAEPVYRDGDVIVVSPAASIRRGDRVLVRLASGEILVTQLQRRSVRRIEFQSLNPAVPDRECDLQDIAWMARIVWSGQPNS